MSDTSGPWDNYKDGINAGAAPTVPADNGISVPPSGFSWSKVPGAIAQIPGQIIGGIKSALALPGDVYAGRTQVNDPATDMPTNEVMDRAAGLAGLTTLGAGAVPAEADALNMGLNSYRGSPSTDIMSSMKSPPPDALRAYELGQKVAAAKSRHIDDGTPTGDFYNSWADGRVGGLPPLEDVIYGIEKNPLLNGFMKTGEQGQSLPVYATGYRHGPAPKSGVSTNFANDGRPELGVSMAKVNHPDFADYNWYPITNKALADPVHYEGWVLPSRGADGEPLMVGPKEIKETPAQPLLRDVLTRDANGRPLTTNPIAPGTDQAIMGAAQANMPPQGIRAYHGSPYDFNAFDASKIGTGEGAQAYGQGLYFAENPAVAKEYRDGVLNMPVINAANSRMSEIAREMDQYRKPGTQRDFTDPRGDALAAEYDQLMATKTAPGKTYEVNINANPDHFLNWDAPLSEQSQHVQDAIKASGVGWHATATPQDILNQRYAFPQREPQQISDALNAAGIPGVRYLDQGSRNANALHVEHGEFNDGSPRYTVNGPQGDRHFDTEADANAFIKQNQAAGTSNYVVFDAKTIDILKKYGIAGLTAGGAGSAAALAGKPSQAEAAPAGPWQKYTEPQTGPWLHYQ